MNFSLLDSIRSTEDAVLVTVVGARGHTYKKVGQQALYAAGRVEPVWGSLGALCADQEIIARARDARATARALVITVDASAPGDAITGTGTACGGALDLLIEPLETRHRAVYAALEPHLADGPPAFLVHDTATGELRLLESEPSPSPAHYVERIDALTPLFLFGATPLSRRLAALASDMDFVVHVVDWRPAFLDLFAGIPHLQRDSGLDALSSRACVVIMSHSYERDLGALRAALEVGCDYVGLLSSRDRRDRMFGAVSRETRAQERLARVHSPVGLDIGARTDPEIAVSIMAEIVGHLRS
jgi:xanthine dehydrogenase accessory factor